MRDLMIDIETLGSRPGSVILSIGAVMFDAETGEMGEELYVGIDAGNAAACGLTTDVATMIWWMKQSDEARRAAFAGTSSLRAALFDLGAFVERSKATRIWAKPPSFDLVLLESAFRACGLLVPWHFRTHRDCRTIFDLTSTKQADVGTAHNALDDAKGQALGVIAAYSKLAANPPPQEHAVPDPALLGIAEEMKESGGHWQPCTGCYDTEDGHPTQKYDYSPALQTAIGCGCHECGGLGAVWWHMTDEQVADFVRICEEVDTEHQLKMRIVRLEAGLRRFRRAYVSLIETGRDRIISLGGSCDTVDVMEAGDPELRLIDAALAATEGSADA